MCTKQAKSLLLHTHICATVTTSSTFLYSCVRLKLQRVGKVLKETLAKTSIPAHLQGKLTRKGGGWRLKVQGYWGGGHFKWKTLQHPLLPHCFSNFPLSYLTSFKVSVFLGELHSSILIAARFEHRFRRTVKSELRPLLAGKIKPLRRASWSQNPDHLPCVSTADMSDWHCKKKKKKKID